MVVDFLTNLSMSAQTSPAQKGLNPGLMCQESYACSGTDEAVFECDECCSLQCLRCEEELHRQERLRNHERIRLKPGHIPYCDPCKGPNGHSPGVRQRAAVRCQTCKINLCLECQKRTHSGGNKRRHPVTAYHVTKAQELLEEEEMDEETKRKKMTEKVVSFLLVDENEEIQVSNEEDFIRKLDCKPDQHLKVVSIFGNTGDGKSHTLNHTFFYGREVFKTSPAQESCTVGVWAAYDPVHKVAVIDTEGLLGATVNISQRTRLLLKVLAISDLVIYRTHADRLHNDLFKFLGDASEAYLKHFTKELKATTARCGLDVPLSTLGPAVIIFHETVHTQLLGSDHPSEVPEKLIQDRFRKLGRFPEAFSSIHYKGTRTYNPPTDFSGLRRALEQQLENNTTRSPRHPGVIFKALKVSNEEDFIRKLDCKPDQHLKVVSIFGNTGDGKSHTLNHTFFYGREVFKTSPAQESCTVGVWAAYDPVHKVAVIDTEGLLGATVNISQRTRLLLKVLAISDLVIYRTHADRLHNDLFKFLGDASEAYLKHFTKELKATTARCGLDVPLSTLGPAVIIFHETVHTQLLGSGYPRSIDLRLDYIEELLTTLFHYQNLVLEAQLMSPPQ